MRTSFRSSRTALGLLVAGAFAMGGCSKVEDTIRGFTGGTKSNDKKGAVPAAVNASASTPAAAAPADPASAGVAANAPAVPPGAPAASLPSALADPAVASKADSAAVFGDQDPVEGKTTLRENYATYKAQGWRDPFVSLVSNEKTSRDSQKVDLSVVKLVAIVNGQDDKFCVVEDAEGTSYILRAGDPVRNGRLLRIGTTSVTASQTILGYTTQVQLELFERKDVKHG